MFTIYFIFLQAFDRGFEESVPDLDGCGCRGLRRLSDGSSSGGRPSFRKVRRRLLHPKDQPRAAHDPGQQPGVKTQYRDRREVKLGGSDSLVKRGKCQVKSLVVGPNSIDWATTVVGEADRELICVTLTYHSSGPIYKISRYVMLCHNKDCWPALKKRKAVFTYVLDKWGPKM